MVMAPSGPWPIVRRVSFGVSSTSSLDISLSMEGPGSVDFAAITTCLFAGSSESVPDVFLFGEDLCPDPRPCNGLYARGVPASRGLMLRLKHGADDGVSKVLS